MLNETEDFLILLVLGIFIGVALAGLFIYRPTLSNIANQFCESKNMTLNKYEDRNGRFVWIDCNPIMPTLPQHDFTFLGD